MPRAGGAIQLARAPGSVRGFLSDWVKAMPDSLGSRPLMGRSAGTASSTKRPSISRRAAVVLAGLLAWPAGPAHR